MLKKLKIATLTVAFLVVASSFAFASVGETTADFLITASGARPQGMGGAFTAVYDDINVLQYNPGGLAFLTQNELSLMYSNLTGVFQVEEAGDMYQGFIAYLISSKKGNFVLSFQYEEQGKFAHTDDSSDVIGTYSLGANYAFSLSYARKINPDLGAGFTVKYITTKLWQNEASAYALDLGLLYRRGKLSAGVSLLNLGTKLALSDEAPEDPLPQRVNAGVAYKIIEKGLSNLIFALDVTQPTYADMEVHVGAEYQYAGIIALRCGYLRKEGNVEGFSQGLGITYGNHQLDFANIPWGELGSVQRLSLSMKF